jgi:hypothetical protein
MHVHVGQAQAIHLIYQQPAFAVCQIDGKEKYTAAGKASTIARHISKLPRCALLRVGTNCVPTRLLIRHRRRSFDDSEK